MDLQENGNLQVEQTKKQESFLENAEKWYKRWLKLPKIYFISIVVIFFIWGIIDPSVLEYGSRYNKYYGVMGLSSGFLCWFVWQIIGWALGGITYALTKLVTSPIILKTEYLRKISEKE